MSPALQSSRCNKGFSCLFWSASPLLQRASRSGPQSWKPQALTQRLGRVHGCTWLTFSLCFASWDGQKVAPFLRNRMDKCTHRWSGGGSGCGRHKIFHSHHDIYFCWRKMRSKTPLDTPRLSQVPGLVYFSCWRLGWVSHSSGTKSILLHDF